MGELIEPYEGPTSITRNSTERSELSERLILTFLNAHATSANVRWERSGFSMEELYRGLWNTCQKDPYKRLVKVHIRNGHLILKRIK